MRQPDLFKAEVKPPPKPAQPVEYKVVALRECPAPEYLRSCDTPQHAADYWRQCVVPTPHYDPEKECFVVLLLTTRRRVKGHHVVGIGLLDQVLVHAREVFRPAIVAAAHAVVVMHNLCAAAHKLCYVKCRIMCGPGLLGLPSRWVSARRGSHA